MADQDEKIAIGVKLTPEEICECCGANETADGQVLYCFNCPVPVKKALANRTV